MRRFRRAAVSPAPVLELRRGVPHRHRPGHRPEERQPLERVPVLDRRHPPVLLVLWFRRVQRMFQRFYRRAEQ